MARWRAMIVDDEPLARARVRRLLAHDPDILVAGECEDGVDAVREIRRLKPDLLFLDVQMPGLDGLSLLEELGTEIPPVTVLMTAHDQYALEAFEAAAIDYLLKPFGSERFHRAVERAKALLSSPAAGRPEPPAGIQPGRRLVVKSAGRSFALPAADVEWVESCGNYVRLHCGGKSWLVRDTMERLESEASPVRLVRVHRTALVNPAKIREIAPQRFGQYEITLDSGARITLSRRFRRKLHAELGQGWLDLLASQAADPPL